MTRRTFWIIFILGAALRLLLIWQAELWYDENFTLVLTRLPLPQMWDAIRGDVHPPLYYLLLWPLGQIQNLPPWTLRIPSALFSIASLALFPRLMRSLRIPATVQLVAFAFMAFLPMQIHYAQEARMYALLELLVIVGALAVLRNRWVLLAFATAALLYTQNYGAFYVAALAAVLAIKIVREWWQHRTSDIAPPTPDVTGGALYRYWLRRGDELHEHWMSLICGMGTGIVAWLLWLPVVRQQAAAIEGNYWIFDTHPGAMLYEVYKLFWAISLNSPANNVTGMLLTFGLMLIGIWYLVVRRPHAWLQIAALAFGPILLAVIASLVYQPLLLFRPLIGVTPFLYLACAYPLGSLPSTRGRLYAACFVAPVMLMGLLGYYHFNPIQKTDQGTGSMREAVAYITEHWQPGDVILHGSGLGWVSMAPYTDLPQYAISNCTTKFPGSISAPTRAAMHVPDGDIDTLPPHRRIWFTAVFSSMLPECQEAHTREIIGGAEPVLVLSETKYLLSAVWLLEG